MSVEPAADLGCGGAGARGARLPVGIAAGCAGPLSPAAAALRTCWKCRFLQPHLGPAEAETPGVRKGTPLASRIAQGVSGTS